VISTLDTGANASVREVLFTGARNQLVVSIRPGDEVAMETRGHVEQPLLFLTGTGKAILRGVEFRVRAGDAVVIMPGVRHSFVNDGREPLKIYPIYAPRTPTESPVGPRSRA
jgi:mannose-6-phosphate isomerase-like protein (cupin superfamily)